MNSAILSFESQPIGQLKMAPITPITEDARWQSVLARDGASDGKFVFAVSSTGVYCRPSCPSKRPRRENVTFYRLPTEAESAGFRACLRCRPKASNGNPKQEMINSNCGHRQRHLQHSVRGLR